jgi:hypothetical protein
MKTLFDIKCEKVLSASWGADVMSELVEVIDLGETLKVLGDFRALSEFCDQNLSQSQVISTELLENFLSNSHIALIVS